MIPGHERQVHDFIDAFERQGVRVWTRRDDAALHVSGHACRAEQQRMIELTQPRAFIPVHGAFVHLQRHAALARSLGVDAVAVENGSVVELDDQGMRVAGAVQTGRVHVQHGGEITAEVLRARQRLAEGGVVVVVLTLDAGTGLAQPPEIAAHGVIDADELDDLGFLDEARAAVVRCIRELDAGAGQAAIELATTRAVRRVFRDALGFRPHVQCVVQRSRI